MVRPQGIRIRLVGQGIVRNVVMVRPYGFGTRLVIHVWLLFKGIKKNE
jgi:hypothetical protein